MSVLGYVRVSTNRQKTENQKLVILEYANRNGLKISDWIEVQANSGKSARARKISELLELVKADDTLIVCELSRLGRSAGQIALLVNELLENEVKLISLKENINLKGETDMRNKIMITMFGLFAEIERDLISERTREGLARARKEGIVLGRPKGSLGKSKLDGKKREIESYLAKGVNKANIARIYGVSWPTVDNFIKSRGLNNAP